MQNDATLELSLTPHDAFFMRRADAQLIVLDERHAIAYAEPGAIELLSDLLRIPKEYLDRLPLPIERAVQEAAGTIERSEDIALSPVPGLLIRVKKLRGRNGHSIIALQVEPQRRRQLLPRAIQRFKLTSREADVLVHILRGLSGGEIADAMCITEATVADYVKRLLRKSDSKNRAEMLAKVFDWQPE